jgi:hypothetical protein
MPYLACPKTDFSEARPVRLLSASAILILGCAKYTPPPPAPPRDATAVSASAGQTWDAVIDLFAARNIPIRTIERVSGLIVTDNLTVGEEGVAWADCGKIKGVTAPKKKKGGPSHLGPNRGRYNVLVRGDSTASTVKATVRWSRFLKDVDVRECSTTHAWEREFEEEIRSRAYAAMRRVDVQMVPSAPTPSPVRTELGAGNSPPQAARPEAPRAARDTPAGRRARAAEEARAKARLPRANAELLLEQEFGLAISDCTRLGLMLSYGEVARDTLVVNLTDEAMTSSATEYNLGRLFDGYLRTTNGSPATLLELRHSGRKVGVYTDRGLTRTNWS